MQERCPVCGHGFERQPGFFTGAMYVSYALAVPLFALLVLAVRRVAPGWSQAAAVVAAIPPLVALTPVLFRYSRVVWMHLVRMFDRDA